MSDVDRDIARLHAATREAHEASQELKDLLREVKKIEAQVTEICMQHLELARNHVGDLIDFSVKSQLDSFEQAMDNAVKDGTESVYNRFNVIMELLLKKSDAIKARLDGMSVLEYIAASLIIEDELDRAVENGSLGRDTKPRPVHGR